MSQRRRSEAPVPFDEREDPKIFWEPDPSDPVIPQPGFISDMIYYARGREVPTLFTIWTTLFAISSVVKREAWLPWADERLYTNYYTIIVGPAGIVKKNEALKQAMRTLEGMQPYIQNPQVKLMKRIETASGSFTPEAFFEALRDCKKHRAEFVVKDENGVALLDAEGRPILYKRTSEIAIAIYEMAATIGRQDYNRGMIEKLLDLYDPQDKYAWRTVKRSKVIFPFTLTTMCALTTPQGFRSSIPPVATSDGFLSRCVVVCQNGTPRCFPEPKVPEGAPSIDELRRRLAWVAEHAMGEYRLSAPARERYYTWYRRFHRTRLVDPRYAGIRSRLPVQILKISLLLHVQRYETAEMDPIIEDSDMESSIKLVNWTWKESAPVVGFLVDGRVTEGQSRVVDLIRNHGPVKRGSLMKRYHLAAEDISTAVQQLAQEGQLRVVLNGVEQSGPSRNAEESYEYVEDLSGADPEDLPGLALDPASGGGDGSEEVGSRPGDPPGEEIAGL